jgi:hypothetical protein
MLWYNASLLKVGVKLGLRWIDALDEVARLSLEVPKLMVFKLIPVYPLYRIFFQKLFQKVIEFYREAIYFWELSRHNHCY